MRKGEQPPWIVSDGLWERIEPLLPKVERRSRHPGRRRLPDRQVLCGILFVLHTGIQWEFLPQELASVGLALGGRAGARLARGLAVPINRMTLVHHPVDATGRFRTEGFAAPELRSMPTPSVPRLAYKAYGHTQ